MDGAARGGTGQAAADALTRRSAGRAQCGDVSYDQRALDASMDRRLNGRLLADGARAEPQLPVVREAPGTRWVRNLAGRVRRRRFRWCAHRSHRPPREQAPRCSWPAPPECVVEAGLVGLALPAAVDLETANGALSLSRTTRYDLAKRGRYPCAVLRLGNAYRVVTADLLKLLHIEEPENAGAEELAGVAPTADTGRLSMALAARAVVLAGARGVPRPGPAGDRCAGGSSRAGSVVAGEEGRHAVRMPRLAMPDG